MSEHASECYPTHLENSDTMNAVLNEPSASAETGARRFHTASSHDILYVEDDAALRSLSANLLLKAGYRVEVAEDGQAGWEVLRLGSYDLLITDHEMPRLNGLELVKRLRSAGQTLPVILSSGSVDADEVHQDDWLRVAATLKKPFKPEDLLETVKQVLRAATGDLAVVGTVASAASSQGNGKRVLPVARQ